MLHRTSDLAGNATTLVVGQDTLSRRSHIVIPITELEKLVSEFLLDCQLRQLTPRTVSGYKNLFRHFFWFMEQQGTDACGIMELKQFFHYLQEPPGEAGRWGKAYLNQPMRPQTAKDYHTALRRLFNWMVSEDILLASPMQKVPAPVVRTGLKQPLLPAQVEAMIKAARVSSCPERNTAILLFLFDTGLRANELCNLKMKDMDFNCRQARVIGKGNKARMCYWGLVAAKALSRYLRQQERADDAPVFTTVGGTCKGQALTPQGLYKIIRDIGGAAGVKCGCHDWRRTFAVTILKNGANLISVQRLMGHETLSITQGYLNIAQTDIEEQHRQFSPADCLKMKAR